MSKLEDYVTWETIQSPGIPVSITAQTNVQATTVVRQGESEQQARERLLMLLREGMLKLATGIEPQSPSGLQ